MTATLLRLISCLPKGREQSNIYFPGTWSRARFLSWSPGSVARRRDSGRLKSRQNPLTNITSPTPSPGLLTLGSCRPVSCSCLPCYDSKSSERLCRPGHLFSVYHCTCRGPCLTMVHTARGLLEKQDFKPVPIDSKLYI